MMARDDQHFRSDAGTLIFDRTPVARLISCAGCFASAALVFHYLAESAGDLEPLYLGGLIVLFLLTLAAATVQYGDHIYIGADGVMYENSFLAWLGRRGSWLRWDELVEIREMRRRILVLIARDGRRLLVDAVAPRRNEALTAAIRLLRDPSPALGYAIAKQEVLRRAPHAARSGTLI